MAEPEGDFTAMDELCGMPDLSLPTGLEERPAIYRSPRAVERAHDRALRFGRTSNITAVVLGDESSDEYFKGILISAIVLFVIFVLWMITLLVLKLCFRRRAGAFSGTPLTLPRTNSKTITGGTTTSGAQALETNQEVDSETKEGHEEDDDHGEPETSPVVEEVVESTVLDGPTKTDEGAMELVPPEEGTGTDDVNENVEDQVEGNRDSEHTNPKEVDDEVEAKEVVVDATEARVRAYQKTLCLRFTVLLGAYGVIVGSILMITKGIVKVEQTASSGGSGLQEGARLATGAADLVRQYADAQKPVVERMETVVQEFNGFCPQIRQNICELDPVSSVPTENCDFTDIPFGDLLSKINLPKVDTDVLFEELDDGEEDLRKLAEDLQEQDEAIEEIEWPFKVARAFAIILLFLAFGLFLCLAYAWRQDYLKIKTPEKTTLLQDQSGRRQARILVCLKSWLLLPSFVLFVVLALVFSTVFVVLSTTTSDVCTDGPDDTILAFLRENEDNIDGLTFRFMEFYVSRCPPDVLPQEFNLQTSRIGDTFRNIANFLDSVRDGRDNVAAICGPDPNPIIETADILLSQLCLIRALLLELGVFFSCENWYPLYAAVAHNTLCDEAALAFRWLATSQGIVVFFAMLLLTARAGLYEMKDEIDMDGNEQPTPLPPNEDSPKDMDSGKEPNDPVDGDFQNDEENENMSAPVDDSLNVQ